MLTPSPPHKVRVPAGSRDWFAPLADPRARVLTEVGVRMVGISEVLAGFDWSGPGANHLLLGSASGSGFLEIGGEKLPIEEGDLVLAPAGLPRRYGTRGAYWKFLTIRLAASERWDSLVGLEARRMPASWLARLLPPVQGMLAEHPLGGALPSHTPESQPEGEDPARYLLSRYANRLVDTESVPMPDSAQTDAFALYAGILRHRVESMLRRQGNQRPSNEFITLTRLWSRVTDRPRGPWDTQTLASSAGVSRTSLYRMVKRQHGTSPIRMVERLRMDQACRLLSESDYSIAVISDQVGYASAFSFSAAFRRIMGTSPSHFRQASRPSSAPS
ncbi:MAG: AraC family transcriptional regulator [Myxococcota bacterium]|jgi:AraC-like DNA-binding protein|nr:AraC family transcriptional regulator [Myxococcota bacterium]